ncbi:MAG: hypothetical protein CMJ49_06080 [Planctomycetaceae bacterium]|nr:hypothetical protein [Planctomycetaceae bacterium]
MAKKVLIDWGGWDGHTPKASGELFARVLGDAGYDVSVEDSMDVYKDKDYMASLDLVVPIWTMATIEGEQLAGLQEAVHGGVGLAGFHGGVLDSFRNDCSYQFMVGGQFVGHPGGIIPSHKITITNRDHEITKGIDDFEMIQTEQYYMHVDPGNDVLCTTSVSGEHGDATTYKAGTVMPYVWTRGWGKGRVFVASWGHTDKDFDCAEALEITKRGMIWAMG